MFAERTATAIWQELPSESNPYIASESRCHGYNQLELIQRGSFIDVVYLLFRGELPQPEQANLLEKLFISLINPGPRSPAAQAAMNAGISRTDYAHILPIALTVQGGAHLGGKETEMSMRFLLAQQNTSAQETAVHLLQNTRPDEGDWHIAPGFGSHFGSIDLISQSIALNLVNHSAAGAALHWAQSFVDAIEPTSLGWLTPGIAAATLLDLGFSARAAAGLFQLMSAPGLLAHGVEMTDKPITTIPFIQQENYVIET